MKEAKVDGVIKLHGYERPEILKLSDEQIDTLIEIDSLHLTEKRLQLEEMTKREIKHNAESFMRRHFRLHKIPYKRVLSRLDAFLLSKIEYPRVSVGLCNALCLNIDPFLLPVNFKGTGEGENLLIANGAILDCEEFYKNAKIYYQGIVLGENVNELTESSYVHEITHTQLTAVKGINGEYYNEEVLPIFLEMVNVYETGSDYLWQAEDVIRIAELLYHTSILYNSLKGNIEVKPDDLLENSLYTTSILKAYSLFIEYINGTPALKKYIFQCIQNIFDSKMPLPELLDEFEIGFESTLKDKKLMKYLTR